jgi:high potential iron-sulfur protein
VHARERLDAQAGEIMPMAAGAPNSKRRFIRLTVVGFAVAPLISALLCDAVWAEDSLRESDPEAKAVKYRDDASLSPDRKDPKAICDNCALFTPKGGAGRGTCELFKGKLVAAKGWCTSWEGF